MHDVVSKTRREQMRFRILAILDTNRPVKMQEDFLLSVLHQCGHPDVTLAELRRELDYLEDRKLVTLERRDQWLCDVTHYGTDIVEGTIETFPGITKPPR